MIVVVRNPYDIIKESADNKNLFDCSDRLQINQNYQEHHFEWWDKWINAQTENLANNHSHILTKVSKQIPTLFVRYEDLVHEPVVVMTDVFKFVLGRDSITGTVLERRISELAQEMGDPDSADCTYLDLFLTQQVQHISSSLADYNSFFGYNFNFESYMSTMVSQRTTHEREESAVLPSSIQPSHRLIESLPASCNKHNTDLLTVQINQEPRGTSCNYVFAPSDVPYQSQKPIIDNLDISLRHARM